MKRTRIQTRLDSPVVCSISESNSPRFVFVSDEQLLMAAPATATAVAATASVEPCHGPSSSLPN